MLTHPCGGLFSAGFFSAAFRAVHPFPVSWKRFAAVLTDSGRRSVEYSFQFCIVGHNRALKIFAQGDVRIADAEHIALAVQRQTAVFLPILTNRMEKGMSMTKEEKKFVSDMKKAALDADKGS